MQLHADNKSTGVSFKTRILYLFSGLLFLLLCGCQQDLYKSLSEKDTNAMMAALLKRGIYATKKDQGKGLFTLCVDEAQVVSSLEILRQQSLPPDNFASLGTTFPKEGMMSSPLEEEARLGYAIAQELAGTCAQIDGVLNARAHVVMKKQDPVTEAITPATASVFLRYLPGSSVEQYVPHIRNLAANAVPNLKYDKTYVFLFPASDTIIMPPPPEYRQFFGIDVAPYAVRKFMITMIIFIGAGAGTGVLGIILFQRYTARKTRAAEEEEENDE